MWNTLKISRGLVLIRVFWAEYEIYILRHFIKCIIYSMVQDIGFIRYDCIIHYKNLN